MQFVEIELDPGESAVAEAGSMMFKDARISMDTVFGDGSEVKKDKGFLSKVAGAGKRLITGESLFTTVFTHEGPTSGTAKARVAFAAPYPGHIMAIKLDELGGSLVRKNGQMKWRSQDIFIGEAFGGEPVGLLDLSLADPFDQIREA